MPAVHPYISSFPAIQHGRHLRSAGRPRLLALPSGCHLILCSLMSLILTTTEHHYLKAAVSKLSSRHLSSGCRCRKRYFHDVLFSSHLHVLPLPVDLAVFRSLAPFCVNFPSIVVIKLPSLSSTYRARGEVVGSNDRLIQGHCWEDGSASTHLVYIP